MARCRAQANYNTFEFVNIADLSQRMDATGRYWYGHKNGAKTSARRPLLGASSESERSLSIACMYGCRSLGYSDASEMAWPERRGPVQDLVLRTKSDVKEDGSAATRNYINHVTKAI